MKIFIEEQRFTQLWFHLLLAISFVVPFVLVTKEFIQSNDKDAAIELYVVIGSILIVYGLVVSLKLKTRIDEMGIQYRFIPFHFSDRLIAWNDISKCYVRKYNPIVEYGGWGLKGGKLWNKRKGIAYNVRGNIGLQLVLKNGKKILIGTQKENELRRTLETYQNKITNYEN
jgi:hypothetical protein